MYRKTSQEKGLLQQELVCVNNQGLECVNEQELVCVNNQGLVCVNEQELVCEQRSGSWKQDVEYKERKRKM